MPGESLSFSITADDRASSKFRDVGRSALDASAKIDVAAASLKLWDDTATKQGKAANTSLNAMKAHTKATALLADAENVLAGRATATTKLMADQGRKLEDAGKTAENAAGGFSALAGTGSLAGGGMGALVAAGVALSPVIATLGTGLAGFGLAAYGVAKPILAAAQATGGLQANLAKLNPEQQQVAQGILGLGQEFAAFQKHLQPEVFGVFNQGLALARTLLHGVEPVAAATGRALGTLLGQVDAEFKSGTWQQFFKFMATTGAADVRQLDTSLVNLVHTLPALIEGVQPLTATLLNMVTVASKLAAVSADVGGGLQKTGASAHQAGGPLSTVANTVNRFLLDLTPLSPDLRKVWQNLAGLATGSKSAAGGLHSTGAAAAAARAPVFSLNTAVANLNTSMTTLVGNLLTLQGGNLSWKQAMQAADAQLRSNNAGLEGNSKNALANRQAVLGSTQAAIGFAQQQLTLGKDIGGASRTVQAQISWLQGLHDKSKFVQDEIRALRLEEQKLQAQRLNQLITVHGKGSFSVVGTGPFAGKVTGFAGGGRIPGSGAGDTVPAMLTPGEAVVPKHLVPAVAPFLKANQVPGFAAGGIVPNYSGSVGGLKPWLIGNDQAMVRLIDQAVVKATLAGIKAAQSAARASASGAPGSLGGPVSAGAAQAQAYARSRLGAYGWSSGQMPPLIALWNGESGWNRLARNPSSGAYGIPQALPPGKMGAAANPPTSSAAAQINWGLGYIKGRYGSPGAAYGAWLSRSPHWYDRGGFLPPGLSMAYNGTGRPEMVIPSRGGAAQHIVLEFRGGSEGRLTGALLEMLRKEIRIRGGTVQAALGRP